MIEGKIYILQDVPITLTMPDDSQVSFVLQRPNNPENPFTFEMLEEAPSGSNTFKDPSRTYQKSYCDYYPFFRLNYSHHRMFTTLLLVAKNIELKTNPGFIGDGEHFITTNCLFNGTRATKNFSGNAVSAYSAISEQNANPIRAGALTLELKGKEPLSWDEALEYYFYNRRDAAELRISDEESISNNEITLHQ